MSFYAKMDDIRDAGYAGIGICQEALENLNFIWQSMQYFVNGVRMEGAAGESLITYINEVHGSIIAGLEEAISSLCTNLTIYFNGYTKYVDSDVHAVLDEYEITDIIKSYDSLFGEFDTLHEELSRTLSNVSDIVSVKKPNIESLENYNESVKKYLRSFVINWYGYESRHNALDFRDFDSIISDVKKLIESQLNETRISPTDYQTCEVVRMTDDYTAFVNHVNASATNRDNLTDEYNSALEEAQETYDKLVQEAAEQRERQGRMSCLAAAGEILTGALVIIGSGGAATPIVIASYVVGGSCAAYGVSNMIEGGQDWNYGAHNNITDEAFNPIRDTLFQGNEEMYTFWGEANMIASSFIMPANKGVQAVSQAKNATSAGQKAVTFVRAAGTEVGKDLVNGAFSTGVGYGVTELTGNQELGMAAGVLSSFAFGKGLDDIDESLNISGLSRPKGLPKTANYADDFDLSTSHAKSSADVDILKPNNLFDNQNFNNPSKISGSDYKNADYLTTNGNKYQYDFEARPVGDYNINTTKNYVTNTSQVDIDFQKPKSYQNRLVTEAIGYGYADDWTVSKTSSSMQDNFFFAESSNGNDRLSFIIKDGRLSIEDIKVNLNIFSGKSANEIAQILIDSGYDVTIKKSAKSRSGAQIIKINNPGGNKNITQVQVSPGGGRHGESPYIKISTRDLGKIKIIDGLEETYKTDGNENATIFFTGGK